MWLHPGKVPALVGVKKIAGALKCVFMSVQWGNEGYKKMSEPCGNFKVAIMDDMSQGFMFKLHHDGIESRSVVTYFAPVRAVPGIYRACADESGMRVDINTDAGSQKIKNWHIVLVDLSN